MSTNSCIHSINVPQAFKALASTASLVRYKWQSVDPLGLRCPFCSFDRHHGFSLLRQCSPQVLALGTSNSKLLNLSWHALLRPR